MRVDILKDENDDLIIENNDFKIGLSDEQHVADIFLSIPGEHKNSPISGFGAIRYVKTNTSKAKFKRDLKIQLSFDGYENATIDLSEGISKTKIEL